MTYAWLLSIDVTSRRTTGWALQGKIGDQEYWGSSSHCRNKEDCGFDCRSHGPCSVHVLSPSDHFPGGSIPHDLIVFSVHRNSLLLFMTWWNTNVLSRRNDPVQKNHNEYSFMSKWLKLFLAILLSVRDKRENSARKIPRKLFSFLYAQFDWLKCCTGLTN